MEAFHKPLIFNPEATWKSVLRLVYQDARSTGAREFIPNIKIKLK
jgi:hypothetical protein